MIVTLTMNPALDITTEIDTVVHTRKLRCGPERHDPGGGGINVARVARELGARSTAIFPAGGAAGDALWRLLSEAGVPVDRVPISGSSRESLTVNELSTGHQYRFVLPGPNLDAVEQNECLDRLAHSAMVAQFVVASGSLPPGVPDDFYQCVAELCSRIGVPLILDSSGAGLQRLRSGVFLLKPSLRELCEYMGTELKTQSDQIAAARSLIDAGRTKNVVVSLGGDGALLVTDDVAQRFSAIDVGPGSGVGAGDAMVAGIVVGLVRGWPLDKAVLLGTATASAMLLTPGTATCRRAVVERLFADATAPVRACGPR